jgi:(2Fe-2S) ferredoxin
MNKLTTRQLLVCTNFRANLNNPSCAGRDSQLVLEQLKTDLAKDNIAVEAVESPCMGYCNVGPNVRLAPNGAFFHEVSAKNLAKLMKAAKKFST